MALAEEVHEVKSQKSEVKSPVLQAFGALLN
jgi:hypothetical protein